MRELTTGTKVYTKVVAVDEPSFGRACHEYQVIPTGAEPASELGQCFSVISFQKGPVKEHGVNGIHNEDLLCILIDRFEGFQKGEYACQENALALTYLQGALGRLRDRTERRTKAGVEGTSQKDPMCAEAQAKADEQKQDTPTGPGTPNPKKLDNSAGEIKEFGPCSCIKQAYKNCTISDKGRRCRFIEAYQEYVRSMPEPEKGENNAD